MIFVVPWVKAQNRCETVVTDAQNQYRDGYTAEVILLLNRCLPDSIPATEQEKAYKILALAYIAEDYFTEAKEVVRILLDLNKNFAPDYSDDPQKFIKYFEEEKKKRLQKTNLKKKIFFIGGGTVLATIVTAAIILSKGDEPQRLPDPPSPN